MDHDGSAIPMLIRCAIGQQERNNIREPDHGCGTRGSEVADSREIIPAESEGVIPGYRAIGVLTSDAPDYGHGD